MTAALTATRPAALGEILGGERKDRFWGRTPAFCPFVHVRMPQLGGADNAEAGHCDSIAEVRGSIPLGSTTPASCDHRIFEVAEVDVRTLRCSWIALRSHQAGASPPPCMRWVRCAQQSFLPSPAHCCVDVWRWHADPCGGGTHEARGRGAARCNPPYSSRLAWSACRRPNLALPCTSEDAFDSAIDQLDRVPILAR